MLWADGEPSRVFGGDRSRADGLRIPVVLEDEMERVHPWRPGFEVDLGHAAAREGDVRYVGERR